MVPRGTKPEARRQSRLNRKSSLEKWKLEMPNEDVSPEKPLPREKVMWCTGIYDTNQVRVEEVRSLAREVMRSRDTVAELRDALEGLLARADAGAGPCDWLKHERDIARAALAKAGRAPAAKCPHDRLDEDGMCRQCGADKRGIG
jgi:hypothetical protein